MSGLTGHLQDRFALGQERNEGNRDFVWTATLEVPLGTNLPDGYPRQNFSTTVWVPDSSGTCYTVVFVERERNFRGDDFLRVYLSKEQNVAVTVRKNSGADVGTRQRLNLIEGSNVTLTVADDNTGNEVDITIAASGGSSNFAGCRLKNSTTQSISTSTFTAATFDQEDFDTDAYHSTSSNKSRITVPTGKAGKYLITGEVTWDPPMADATLRVQIYLNGTTVIGEHSIYSSGGNETVEVEVLDVNDHEARALLLAIDPLAQLAGYDAENLAELRKLTEHDSQAVTNLWNAITEANHATEKKLKKAKGAKGQEAPQEKYQVILDCDDERHQVELLRRFKKEGFSCRALIT